jgi:thioredoxin-like negative regulator of GroEL
VALKKPRFHKVKALVIDVEEYPMVAKNLYVRSLPHTILYKQGVMTKIITTSYGMAAAEALLDSLL